MWRSIILVDDIGTGYIIFEYLAIDGCGNVSG